MRSVAFYTTSCALWNRPYFKSLIFLKFRTIGGTLWWKNPIFSPTANYGSLKSAQKIQSNGTVIIAYSWFYDELQASEFLTFPFSKLKLKFPIWNGGTLKLQFRFHYQITICYSEKYRCSTKNEFQFPFHIWNFSLSNWNMKWKVSWNWAIVSTATSD